MPLSVCKSCNNYPAHPGTRHVVSIIRAESSTSHGLTMPKRCIRSCLFAHFGVTPVDRRWWGRTTTSQKHKKLHYLIVCARNYVFSSIPNRHPTLARARSHIKRISFRTFEFSVETIFQLNC